MGKPSWGHAQLLRSEHIGAVETTGGIETSQYLEEEKTTCDSLSSGERNGNSPNRCGVIALWRCHTGVAGPTCQDTDPGEELQKRRLVEHSWKAGPERVTAPVDEN